MSLVPDYRTFYEAFDPSTLTDGLSGDFVTGVNACVECCDRHVGEGRVALKWANAAGDRVEYTFEQLQARSAQVANLLVEHGRAAG